MKHFYLFFFVFSLITIENTFATMCMSVQNGAWSNAATWSCGRAPACGDTIRISHLVEITATVDLSEPGCTTPTFIVITSGGDLNFNSGRKLSLACGSGVTINAGGQMTSDGGGASENLKICNTIVWQGSWDPDLDGPVVLGSGLPIELISFNAHFENQKVKLSWQTASEINNDYFTVERSPDGISFHPILITDGAGNSNVILNYAEVDFSPFNGLSYYRLKQTDYDGNYSFSQIVAVNSHSEINSVEIYPNPNNGEFQVALSDFESENVVLSITDISGKLILSQKVNFDNSTTILFSLKEKLNGGLYFLSIKDDKNFQSFKIVIE